MVLHSSGVLLFRRRDGHLEVLLVHPGGPFWANKDEGSWSIPKGIIECDENPLDAAKREFAEETGIHVDGKFIDLGQSKGSRKKTVHAWALEDDLDPTRVSSNSFSVEWPKRSGIIREYPEVDRAGWFDINQAREKIQSGQAVFIDRLIDAIDYRPEAKRCQTSLARWQQG
jgi:predicted NUDIX family NTP pyrophosphohydrolase